MRHPGLNTRAKAHCHLILAQARGDWGYGVYYAGKAIRLYGELDEKPPTFLTSKLVFLNAFEEVIEAVLGIEEAAKAEGGGDRGGSRSR